MGSAHCLFLYSFTYIMIENSISNVLDNVVKATANNMQLYAAIHEAVFSNQPSVKTQVYLESGEARDLEIPSLGYMKSRVDRIDSTLEMLTGVTGDSIVRMPDGSYRKMYINRLDIPRATEFISSKYTLQEAGRVISMMEKDITVDIPLKLYNKEDKVELNIIAIHGDVPQNAIHESNLTFSELKQALDTLQENGRLGEYANYKVLQPIEPADMSAYGGVYVLRVVDTASIDANDNVEHKKIYYISDIAFRGKEGSIYPISQGDVLTLYSSNGQHDTRVKVEVIDKTKAYIKVSYVDGYQPITIGSQLFPYIDENRTSGVVKYSVSNRYKYWIFPTLITKSGYRHEEGRFVYVDITNTHKDILDIGKYLDKFKKDTYKTIGDWEDAAIQPEDITPNIEDASFTIVDVSRDISTTSYTKITQLESQKKSVENSIAAYRDRINVLRNIISTGTTIGASTANELAQVTQALNDAQNEFNTLVFNISDELSSNALESNYEIHGVVKMNADTEFDCIGIEVRYRFVGTDDEVAKKEYYELNGTNVPFNVWKYTPFIYRGRKYDESTGKYRWDPNTIIQTSINIPIEARYNTIINYRYVFEAGYPENPMKSVWSDDIEVLWDATLERSSMKALQNINQADQVKASVNNTMATNGMYRHIENSFTSGEVYFAHSADEIASGFVSEEQKPITLYEKLKDIITVSTQLNDAFNAVDINNFKFTLVHPDGREEDLHDGDNTITTPTYMEALKSQNGKTISVNDEKNTDYVVNLNYILRISAKSKYVRFLRLQEYNPLGYNIYSFSTADGDSYKPGTLVQTNPPMVDNKGIKVALASTHNEMKMISHRDSSSKYRDAASTDKGFATIMKGAGDQMLFNQGSTLSFADEASIEIPVTVVVAPISLIDEMSVPLPQLIALNDDIISDIKLYAKIGSYINSLDLTLNLKFITKPK